MNFSAVINKISVVYIILILFTGVLFAQSAEDIAYQKAEELQDNMQKIEAYKNFISTYPESQRTVNALLSLFSIYLEDNKIDTALNYADQAVKSVPDTYKISIYNDAAYSLAQKKVGLDTADVYSRKAVAEARENHSRYLGTFLDTRALVLYCLGKADSALILEKEAIAAYREDPSFLSSLAIYQEAAGDRTGALKTAAKAVLLGNTDEALTNFNKWITEVKNSAKEQDKLRKEIAELTLKDFFKNNRSEDKMKVNSVSAVFFAFMNVNLNQANKWIKAAINSLNNKSAINDRILFTKNYGIVLFAEGKYSEALKQLTSIREITDLWDSDYWYTLGRTYQKVNKNSDALDAYITGSIFLQSRNLQNALKELSAKEGISEDKIKTLIEQKKNEQAEFEPGKYTGKKSDNVLLAEIFTGSECGPCAAADYALEDISGYFTRKEVAILEYHVHIPAPDPLTNPDTFGRYKFYGGNFGTPMVIIQGNSQIGGGGPKFLTRNRFNIYKYSLEKYLYNNNFVNLNGSAELINDSVLVNMQINKEKKLDDGTVLNIALVEKSVQYPGGNGVTNQLYVVRNLINGATGTSLESAKGNESMSASFNLSSIEKKLSGYLDDPTKDPSWRRNTPFNGWKQRNDKLNRSNLAVVAWVQDSKTKEVLQSVYLDVPYSK